MDSAAAIVVVLLYLNNCFFDSVKLNMHFDIMKSNCKDIKKLK